MTICEEIVIIKNDVISILLQSLENRENTEEN